VAVLDVAVGELSRRLERLVGDRDAVVRLVAVAETAEDLHGVVDGRLLDAHLLEAALEGGVALEVLAVLVERRRADRLQLAAGESRLEDRGRVDRALGAPAPTRLWSSSMNRTMSPRCWISFMTFFSRSSNSPRYFEPATSAARSSE
jgi:hypothetical protein